MIDHLATHRGPARLAAGARRRCAPASTRPLPHKGRDLAHVLSDFTSHIKPYVTGNTHPLFMGWVHGAGTPVGMLAEMLAAGLNANCGGRNHIGIDVERQMTRWFAEVFGFPRDASGVFVTGTSMANFLGLLIARNEALGQSVRADGLRAAPAQLTAYTSAQAHGCIAQALELSGIGSRNLRQVPVDAAGAMRLDRLEAAIAKDRRQGHLPFLIVGTAGSVNTGAMDDLNAIADVAEAHKLWFHVDGAFGALAALSKRLRPLVAGIERAQSIAFDLHKWAHVPYDAGFLLVRDAEAHRRTFANRAAYLQRAPRGLGAGEVWPCDLGPDLSRGFRALKVWFTLETLGADRIAASIERCCRVAQASRAAAAQAADVRGGGPGRAQHRLLQGARRQRRGAASRRHGPAGARAGRPVADRARRADGDPRGHRQPPHHHAARGPLRRAPDGQHARPTAGRDWLRAVIAASPCRQRSRRQSTTARLRGCAMPLARPGQVR